MNDVDRAIQLREVHVKWDTNDDIYTFFTNIKLCAQNLEDNYEIVWPDDLKLVCAIESLYKCGVFTRAEKKAWEAKDEADKTWVHAQTYFGDLWDADQQFTDQNAKGEGFGEGMNNIREAAEKEAEGSVVEAMREVALTATADKEHIQQMSTTADDLLTVVKRQQTVIEKQQTTIEGLTAHLSKLITQNGELSKAVKKGGGNKSNPQPRGGPRGGNRRRGEGLKRLECNGRRTR